MVGRYDEGGLAGCVLCNCVRSHQRSRWSVRGGHLDSEVASNIEQTLGTAANVHKRKARYRSVKLNMFVSTFAFTTRL